MSHEFQANCSICLEFGREGLTLRSLITAVAVLVSCVLAAAGANAGTTEALVEVLHEQGVIDDSAYNRLSEMGVSSESETVSRELIEILHQQGTIDDASYHKLTDGKVAPTETMPMSSDAAEDRPVEKAFRSVEEGFARLGADTVKLRIGVWLQGGWVSDDSGATSSLPNPASSPADTGNQFYIRFARPYFKFRIADKVGLRIMLDATGSPPLRDAYLYLDYIPYARITVGQFLTRFGSETWRAPFELPMINYSLPASLMQFPNLRDIGITASGSYDTELAGFPFGAGYTVGLIQGSGMNTSDNNDHKDFIGRVTLKPFVPGLEVGGSWYIGRSNHTVAGINTDKDWDRWAVEMNYAPEFIEGLGIQAEYMFARRFYTAYGTTAAPLNRHVHQDGWYAQVAYRPGYFEGPLIFLNDFEPKFRFDTLDEDKSSMTAVSRDNTRHRYTVGLNYWLNRYCRLLLDYEIIEAGAGLTAKSISKIDVRDHNMFTTNFQIWF